MINTFLSTILHTHTHTHIILTHHFTRTHTQTQTHVHHTYAHTQNTHIHMHYSVSFILTFGTPHRYPVIACDAPLLEYYHRTNYVWRDVPVSEGDDHRGYEYRGVCVCVCVYVLRYCVYCMS